MSGPARRHHFVSAFLLAGFTASGGKSAELCVTDFKTRKQFIRTPETTGFQTDFHTIEMPGVKPDFLEKEILADIEARCAPTIKAVLADRAMPKGQAYCDLIYFTALMMVKTPKARRIAEGGVDWLNKLLVRQSLETEEDWNALQAEMRQAGMEIHESVTYEQMIEFVGRDRYQFKPDQNWILAAMMESAVAMLPHLVSRMWSVLHSSEGGLICSDHPATCSFVGPVPALWTPAPGLPHTEVQLPLSRNLILIGSLERPATTGGINRKGAAYYNSRTLLGAERFAYSTERDFIWLDRNESIKSGLDELVATRKRPASGSE
jgi:hypothetical protein